MVTEHPEMTPAIAEGFATGLWHADNVCDAMLTHLERATSPENTTRSGRPRR